MLRRYYGKISKLPIDQFTGHDGELVVDDLTGRTYVMDGVTLGGHELAGATPRYEISAPTDSIPGALWYEPNSGRLFIYYNNQWVDAAPNTTYTLPEASATELGGVKVDNETIVIDEYGVISAITDLSGIGSIGQQFSLNGSIKQLSVLNDVGKLITIETGVGVLRLPQITSTMLGSTFEFYFAVDAGQIHIQSYYTGVRATTDVFRGSIFVGVDNATTGKLHNATATTLTACDLFLGQHHAKAGSYIKVKAIKFNSIGTWMFQGTCIGDTGQTPNGSNHPFQDYN